MASEQCVSSRLLGCGGGMRAPPSYLADAWVLSCGASKSSQCLEGSEGRRNESMPTSSRSQNSPLKCPIPELLRRHEDLKARERARRGRQRPKDEEQLPGKRIVKFARNTPEPPIPSRLQVGYMIKYSHSGARDAEQQNINSEYDSVSNIEATDSRQRSAQR